MKETLAQVVFLPDASAREDSALPRRCVHQPLGEIRQVLLRRQLYRSNHFSAD